MHNNSCKQKLFIVLTILVICLQCDNVISKNNDLLFNVEAQILYDEDNINLKMILKNEGNSPLIFNEVYLPWRPTPTMIFCVIPLDDKRAPLRELTTIEDPGITLVKLKPGETLDGKILLQERFPEINNFLRKDILIFWNYYIPNVGKEKRIGGWLIIHPKERNKVRP